MAAAAPSSSSKKMVRLRSSDGREFEVPEAMIGAASATIRGLIDEGCAAAAGVVALPNVPGATLSRVLEYVDRHFDPADPPFGARGGGSLVPGHGTDDDPYVRFDDDFVSVDTDALIDLAAAASYLDIGPLMDLTCSALADMIRGRTTDEIRTKFNIVNDYTDEEMEEIRRENSWAFE